MQSALKNGDLTQLGDFGHRLKGTLVYLGAHPATEAAVRIERLARQIDSQAKADEALKDLEQQCEILKEIFVRQGLI